MYTAMKTDIRKFKINTKDNWHKHNLVWQKEQPDFYEKQVNIKNNWTLLPPKQITVTKRLRMKRQRIVKKTKQI